MTRVIHTGDTHLGYRQYHVAERKADFLAAFRQVIDDAIAEEVDAVIHAGDLFHDRRPNLGDLLGTIDVLSTLAAADIPFLAIVGNHEGTRDRQWLDLFEALELATRLDRTGTVVGAVTFYGLDYVPPSQRSQLEYRFEPPETDAAALVSHGLFEPFAHADWDTEHLLAESNVAFDAVLLGDNHAPGQEIVDETWVTYCGSTERTSAAEREERGYNLVTFDEDVRIARRGLDVTREFVFVDVELGQGEGIERVREQLRQHELADAVVLVSIEGEGEEITPADVETYATERGALVARVTDRREFDVDETAPVHFADPDDAVRERVRELGLSGAARDVDEIVRASKVADTNVRETVESHVRELLEDGLPSFETADGAGADAATDSVETAADRADDGSGEENEAQPGAPATAGSESGKQKSPTCDAADDGVDTESVGSTEGSNGAADEAEADRESMTSEADDQESVTETKGDQEQEDDTADDHEQEDDTAADKRDDERDGVDSADPIEPANASSSGDGESKRADGESKPTETQSSIGEFQ